MGKRHGQFATLRRPLQPCLPGASLPPYERRDLKYVADAGERPTNQEYDRYLWLVEEAKQAGYDQQVLSQSSSFDVGDVFFTALFAAANDDLAELAALVGAPEVAEARGYAERARAAVAARTGPSGLASDIDLRTGEDLEAGTIAGFAPLIAGQLAATRIGQVGQVAARSLLGRSPRAQVGAPAEHEPVLGSFPSTFVLARPRLAGDQLAPGVGPGTSGCRPSRCRPASHIARTGGGGRWACRVLRAEYRRGARDCQPFVDGGSCR